MTPQHGYLIFKCGRGYYCAEAKGYTLNADEAGRFSLEDAIAYSHPNGPDGPRDGITYQHESEVQRGSDCESELRISDLTRERDELREAKETLSQELADALERIATLEAEKRGMESAAETIARAYA